MTLTSFHSLRSSAAASGWVEARSRRVVGREVEETEDSVWERGRVVVAVVGGEGVVGEGMESTRIWALSKVDVRTVGRGVLPEEGAGGGSGWPGEEGGEGMRMVSQAMGPRDLKGSWWAILGVGSGY